MKIGIIIGSLGYGGAERVTLRLAEWFVKKGYSVSIYTTMNPPEKEYELLKNVNRYMCHKRGKGFYLIRELRNTIKKDGPDIVIVMDTPMCVYAVPALIGLQIPFIVAERSNPKTKNIKKITRILSHILMKKANGFIFQTNDAKNCYSKYIQEKSFVIPNPLKIEDLPEPYIGERTKRIVAVGRIVSAKNYPLLIEAFNMFNFKYPEYRLEIYGEGKEREKLEKLIKTMENKKNIYLKGVHSDVLEKISSAELYVLTSDLEGMPNALIEAMAIGIPVISTDCPSGGPADLIKNMQNGILVPIKDKKALIEALEILVTNIELQKKLSKNGLEIRKRLNIENIGNIWLKEISKIMRDSYAIKNK